MVREFDTIAAIATSVSNAGIGKIRISGDDSLNILEKIFEPYTKRYGNGHWDSHRIYLGNIKDGEEVIDEVIVLIMKGPHSYTREDVVEVDCHGGVHVVYKVLNLILKNGARAAEPGEFTKRAFLNGRIDLSQAEAVMGLIESKNEASRKNSILQMKGNLSEKIGKLREEILYEIAYIESALDDPEHISLDGYADGLLEKVEAWIRQDQKLLSTYDDGRYISEGIRTCIVGKPNAGKSSFLNVLLGEERAIVTDVAGTTRDTLEESVTIDGITLNIIDTAGIHETEDKVEKIGVEKAKKEITGADLVVCILDMAEGISEEDVQIFEQIKDKKKMVLLNKSDLGEAFSMDALKEYVEEDTPCITISAKYNQGIDLFTKELKNMMFHGTIDETQDLYITNARHKNALDEALEGLKMVKTSIENQMPEDFFTIDLMNAYESLGSIIGESLEEDLVNEIFSKFCTGK
ncbi:MAG: tRNA uridine-5-carboxymethylaminomethyl(34) synthesis GTPase MnmE [Eubacteriales bacterium]|nr:tRNA uridine-5-carboxymethylaminomethyl(34) synthesis GTPase MnmE [Eubacteriales bacterium]